MIVVSTPITFGADQRGALRSLPGRGEHDLMRARGQWLLHGALLAARGTQARMLALP